MQRLADSTTKNYEKIIFETIIMLEVVNSPYRWKKRNANLILFMVKRFIFLLLCLPNPLT